MSREIKFRVWDSKSEKMLPIQRHSFKTGKSLPYGWNIEREFDCLMQYTGIKDMNLNEIYEGDIIRQVKVRTKEDNIDENNYKVIFKYGCFWLQRPYENTVYIKDFPTIDEFVGFECFEVIGNIYENPDLLKEDK